MTMKLSRAIAAMGLLAASFAASAETHEFDTITTFSWGSGTAQITGVARNSSTTINVPLGAGTAHNHCIPMLLTMMEKPGRYYLTLITSSPITPQPLQKCALTIRN
jgi:hypothetical protein